MKHHDREEILELEDGGMAELLLLKNKVTELITGIVSSTEEDAGIADTQKSLMQTEQLTLANSIDRETLNQSHPVISSHIGP